MKIGPSTPVLRIFDVAKARAFYLDYLGFSVDFEHRFEDALPLLGIGGPGQDGDELPEDLALRLGL